MNVFVKFDEIPSMTLQDIKETKCYGHTFVRSFGRSDNVTQSQFAGGIKRRTCMHDLIKCYMFRICLVGSVCIVKPTL